jgi:hypothetical protein
MSASNTLRPVFLALIAADLTPSLALFLPLSGASSSSREEARRADLECAL